jgi:hypothetical protein
LLIEDINLTILINENSPTGPYVIVSRAWTSVNAQSALLFRASVRDSLSKMMTAFWGFNCERLGDRSKSVDMERLQDEQDKYRLDPDSEVTLM